MIIKIEADTKEDILGKSFEFFCSGMVKDSTEEFACSGCNEASYRILLPLNGDGKCPSGKTAFKLDKPQPIPKIGLKVVGKNTIAPDSIWEIIDVSTGEFVSIKLKTRFITYTESVREILPHFEPGQPVLYEGVGYFIKKMERHKDGYFLYYLLMSSWDTSNPSRIAREVDLPTEKQLLDAGFDPDKWWCV